MPTYNLFQSIYFLIQKQLTILCVIRTYSWKRLTKKKLAILRLDYGNGYCLKALNWFKFLYKIKTDVRPTLFLHNFYIVLYCNLTLLVLGALKNTELIYSYKPTNDFQSLFTKKRFWDLLILLISSITFKLLE